MSKIDVIVIDSSDEESSNQCDGLKIVNQINHRSNSLSNTEQDWWMDKLSYNMAQRQYILSQLDELHALHLPTKRSVVSRLEKRNEDVPPTFYYPDTISMIYFPRVFDDSFNRCCFCLNNLQHLEDLDHTLHKLVCKHLMCNNCLNKWDENKNGEIPCPSCRKTIYNRK